MKQRTMFDEPDELPTPLTGPAALSQAHHDAAADLQFGQLALQVAWECDFDPEEMLGWHEAKLIALRLEQDT